MENSEPLRPIEVLYLFFITLVSETNKYALFLHLNSLPLTGKICCNSSVLASWKWVPFLMEQYADYRRLLYLLVSGNSYMLYFSFHLITIPIYTTSNFIFCSVYAEIPPL